MAGPPNHPPERGNELSSDSQGIDPRDFRNALGTYGTGVSVITACVEGQLAGLTCNSFASVSLNPPLVLWSLVAFSPSLPIFQNASHFAVNVLAGDQRDLATQFATRAEDKFAGVSWTPGLGGAPVLPDVVATFECRSADRYYGGDHVIFLGAVEAYAYNQRDALLFSRGKFGHFASA